MTSPDDDAPARPSELVVARVVYGWLGVRRQQARAVTRDRRFPAPWLVDEPSKTWIWRRDDVVAWMVAKRPERAAELDAAEPGWRDGR